jgi:flagellar biogenesis protein FliO
MESAFLSTTASLIVVCALAVLALKALARRQRRGTGPLKIVARLQVEARRSVCVIEAGGRCFLVGMGDGPMALLAELDPAALKEAEGAEPARSGVLAEAFRRVMLGRGA